MAIKLEFSDGVKAASRKHLGDGPGPAQVRAAVAQMQEASATGLEGFGIERLSEPVDLMPDDLAPTPATARAAMHAALDRIIDELEAEASFCGLQIDEHRFADESKRIACINFVPIDMISGTAARRIPHPA